MAKISSRRLPKTPKPDVLYEGTAEISHNFSYINGERHEPMMTIVTEFRTSDPESVLLVTYQNKVADVCQTFAK